MHLQSLAREGAVRTAVKRKFTICPRAVELRVQAELGMSMLDNLAAFTEVSASEFAQVRD